MARMVGLTGMDIILMYLAEETTERTEEIHSETVVHEILETIFPVERTMEGTIPLQTDEETMEATTVPSGTTI